MALVNENYMRAAFKIHKDVANERITPYIAVASRRLKKWVGANRYEDDDTETQEILKIAEGLLAMHLMILNLNTSIRPEGLVRQERIEGDVTIQYFSPNEGQQTAQQFLDQADEIIREFLAADDYGTPGLVLSDGFCEASTRKWRT